MLKRFAALCVVTTALTVCRAEPAVDEVVRFAALEQKNTKVDQSNRALEQKTSALETIGVRAVVPTSEQDRPKWSCRWCGDNCFCDDLCHCECDGVTPGGGTGCCCGCDGFSCTGIDSKGNNRTCTKCLDPTPAPTPAPGTFYHCTNGKCVPAAKGVSQEDCKALCAPLYQCVGNKCVVAETGVSQSTCEMACGPAVTRE
jgi:hypothetical protein